MHCICYIPFFSFNVKEFTYDSGLAFVCMCGGEGLGGRDVLHESDIFENS